MVLLPDVGAGRCPATCQELGANCGTVTDVRCGGVLECGSCADGEVCGAETHNVCEPAAVTPPSCVPRTCQELGVGCGSTGDGCEGTLSCGGCTGPKICGGDPAKPGQCGCTGQCSKVAVCSGGAETSLTGAVYDPAGIHPLPDALVYVPNDPSDPGLGPMAAGISCDVCGASAAGRPLVTTFTAVDGSFTLTGVPVGATIPLVIQLGRWRRQFSVKIDNACAVNPLPTKLTMPKNQSEGDLPRIAILSGGFDPVECTLRKMGVDDREFTNPGGGGRINFFMADESGRPDDSNAMNPGRHGAGATIDQQTPPQSALFASSGGRPLLNQYDIVILECEGYEQAQSASDLSALRAYANSGGRVLASDFAYAWLYKNGDFAKAANWHVGQNTEVTVTPVGIDGVSNPKGKVFEQWLEAVGISAPGSHQIPGLGPVFRNADSVIAPTQLWLSFPGGIPPWPIHFTFNTPIGAADSQQCGRVVFSDWHAEYNAYSRGKTFPAECPNAAITTQQSILEFMLFDLSACVQPYTPVCRPKTCADLKIDCGPAGDGCGGLLACGSCPTGQSCGGGGPGKCGSKGGCEPATCASQQIGCGPAGDGCGARLDCGACPTGEICGFQQPGQCGHAVVL